jgi:CubicO group peptidase (beta-lactamase class C family)
MPVTSALGIAPPREDWPMGNMRGSVASGFEPVKAAFEENMASRVEVGAAVSVWHRGREVVNLAGGVVAPGGAPFGPDTLQLVFSTTKGAVAICVGMCVERGLIDLDAPVARYWPEFAAAGKEGVTVAELMSHRVGLTSIDAKLSLADALDWATVTKHLAAQAPYWEPCTAHGYHALTYGWLAGELVRRVDGRSVGAFLREEVATPLEIEFYIGLPEQLESRVAPLIAAPPPSTPEAAAMLAQVFGPGTFGGNALSLNGAFVPSSPDDDVFNRRDVHAAEVPATNGITTASSLAKMYAACVGEINGVRLLSPAYVDRARIPLTSGADRCLVADTTFGIGFMTHGAFSPMLGPGSFGHPGAGGSVGAALPEKELAFGYVMNQMQMNLAGDDRVTALTDALAACV